MSHIISLLPRHYIGTAAEIAGITGVCGDTAYSSDTDVYYHWEGAAWLAGGIPFFVERLVAVPDKQVGDFTCDGNWHVDGLNLQPILPAGAFQPKLLVSFADDAANSYFELRRDAVNVMNRVQPRTAVANIGSDHVIDIAIDTNRLLDYRVSNLVITTLNVTVLGWWIRRCL